MSLLPRAALHSDSEQVALAQQEEVLYTFVHS
jgi:hypothetical protein